MKILVTLRAPPTATNAPTTTCQACGLEQGRVDAKDVMEQERRARPLHDSVLGGTAGGVGRCLRRDDEDLAVVGETVTGREAIDAVRATRADVVLAYIERGALCW